MLVCNIFNFVLNFFKILHNFCCCIVWFLFAETMVLHNLYDYLVMLVFYGLFGLSFYFAGSPSVKIYNTTP